MEKNEIEREQKVIYRQVTRNWSSRLRRLRSFGQRCEIRSSKSTSSGIKCTDIFLCFYILITPVLLFCYLTFTLESWCKYLNYICKNSHILNVTVCQRILSIRYPVMNLNYQKHDIVYIIEIIQQYTIEESTNNLLTKNNTKLYVSISQWNFLLHPFIITAIILTTALTLIYNAFFFSPFFCIWIIICRAKWTMLLLPKWDFFTGLREGCVTALSSAC